jgi:hypothetical protein
LKLAWKHSCSLNSITAAAIPSAAHTLMLRLALTLRCIQIDHISSRFDTLEVQNFPGELYGDSNIGNGTAEV